MVGSHVLEAQIVTLPYGQTIVFCASPISGYAYVNTIESVAFTYLQTNEYMHGPWRMWKMTTLWHLLYF